MKKTVRFLIAAALTAALLGCGAFAADGQIVGVQLDGKDLSFTDAVPQVRDQRTFLPFRAVFEAMGAQVSWSADAPDTVGASRDGTTVTMTLGSTAATVEKNGVRTTLEMDVAPFAEGGRTYVPVRFAAQAFGCAVGWDQEAYTAILVDTDKLVAGAAQGKSFTYLEKFVDCSKKYNEGIWNCDMTMDGSLTMMGFGMPIAVTAQGTTEGEGKVDLDMNMKLDMAQLIAFLEQMSGGQEVLTAEERAMLDAMKTDGIDMTVRGDMATGMLYMNMSGKVLENAGMAEAGIRPDIWYSMDMETLLEGSGMDMTELIKQSGKLDYETVARLFLDTLTLNTAGSEGYGVSYEVFKSSAENLAFALSDAGFTRDGDKYTASIDGGLNKMELSLTMENGAVTASNMVLNMTMSEQGVAASVLVDMGVDQNDRVTGKMTMDVGGMMSMALNISGGYTRGTAAPVTKPPAGAEIVDYMSLMNGLIME